MQLSTVCTIAIAALYDLNHSMLSFGRSWQGSEDGDIGDEM